MTYFGSQIQITARFSGHSLWQRHKLLRRKTYKSMSQGKSQRPICPSCSKPTRTCFCSRILNPNFPNSVNVTILQHALECKHPLNSARIARLGLKNLTLATVSDVNFEARFLIHLLDPNSSSRKSVPNETNCLFFNEIEDTQKLFSEKDSNFIDSDGLKNDDRDAISDGVVVKNEQFEKSEGAAITITIGKNGVITSLSNIWKLQCQSPKLSFNEILSCPEACEALSKGFLVKKLLNSEFNFEEYEEFEVEVGPGSVLLFPSDKAVNVSDLDVTGFEVKNLIVLDGTWAKAKRIYSENPWLNILPHLKLEVNATSLYGDVRRQPKAGYLSTIESIVFALKAIGENHEGLDNLLDTFESMVGDQRRFREERLSKPCPS